MLKILEQARALVTPSHAEQEEVRKILTGTKEIIERELKRQKVDAEVLVGGSVARGTWLPGTHDADFFIRFEYEKYQSYSNQLSDILETILKSCFRTVHRLHGSRDYFQVKENAFVLEFIPALKITKASQAKNITDISPLHVIWVKRKVREDAKLCTEIRLAKMFLKAQGIYGAESYIGGFSGHVTEILTSAAGSFINLLKHLVKFTEDTVVDVEKYYHSRREVLEKMNDSKIYGPLIVVDPCQPERNAAAALRKDKFLLAQKAALNFLKNPDLSFFRQKKVTLADLKTLAGKNKLVALKVLPADGKKDVVGAKLLKKFEEIKKLFVENEFKLLRDGWQWFEGENALFWYILELKILPATKLILGPPVSIGKKYIADFQKKYKKFGVKSSKQRYYSEIPREIRRISQVEEIVKKDKNIKIIS